MLGGSYLSTRAYAEGVSDIGTSVFDDYVTSAAGAGRARWDLARDLAWRYYQADASKRDKVPLTPAWYGVGELTDYANYEDWRVAAYSNGVVLMPYNFRVLDGNSEWDVTTPNADIEYAKWYDYYEDTTPDDGGGSGGDNDGELPDGMYGGYVLSVNAYNQTIKVYESYSSNNYDTVPASTYQQCILVFNNEVLSNEFEAKLNYERMLVGEDGNINAANNSDVTFYTQDDARYRINAYQKPSTLNNVTLTTISIKSKTQKYIINEGKLYSVVSVGIYNGFVTQNATWNNGTSWNFTPPTYAADEIVTVGPDIGGDNSQPLPVLPPIQRPEVPETPTAPTEPTVTPTQPTIVQYQPNDTTTTTADLTPILEAIRILNDNLVSGFANMQSEIETCCANMRDMLGGWYSYLGEWASVISGQIAEWNDLILQELRIANEWFDAIYNKITGGGGSIPDATLDDGGYWDWLDDLAGAVLGNLPEAATELLDAFTGLRGLFPFSIPWDLGALLLLFVSSPVTPVFSLPVPYSASGVSMVTVDLSGWDGVMAAVRSIELVAFAAGLALKTRAMLKNTEVSE